MESVDNKLQEVIPTGKEFKMLVTSEVYDNHLNNLSENFTAGLILNRLHDGDLFIDIGARYGYYTLLAGSKYANCDIIALEPSPSNFEILRRNIDSNALKNVEVYNPLRPNDEGDESRIEKPDYCKLYEHQLINMVRILTADLIIKKASSRTLIIKIDTEGHEISVLKEIQTLLNDSENIEVFMVINPKKIRKSGHQPEDLLGLLDTLGFNVYFIDDEKRQTYRVKDPKRWPSIFSDIDYNKGCCNILCVKKEKSLNICIFSHTSQLAGAERSLLELTAELIRNHGALCTVVMPNDGPLKSRLEEIGSSTILYNYYWWCDAGVQSQESIDKYYKNSYNELRKHLSDIEKCDPDVIMTNTMVIPWGAITAAILNRPHVWYVREFGQIDHGLKFYLPHQDMIDIIETSNLVITNSNAVKKTLFKESLENIVTVYNNVKIQKQPTTYGNDYFTEKNTMKLMVIGHVAENKGQKYAILAVKELINRNKDVELTIMGEADPVYLEELKSIVNGSGIEKHVKFVSFNENPYSLMSQSDIIIVCSKNEAFGRTILEAWLLKKPVIATDSGGIPELVQEGFNGLLYQYGDYTQLAKQIEYMIENREKISEFGNNGFEFTKANFTEEKYGGEVYKHLMLLKGKPNLAISPFSRFIDNLMERELLAEEAEIKQARSEIEAREAEIKQARSEIQQKDDNIKRLYDELNPIKNSLIWRSVVKFQSLIDKLMPQGTKRRAAYEKVFTLIRKI